MSENRYGLDWTLWGTSPRKPQDKQAAPLQSLHDTNKGKNTNSKKPVENDNNETDTTATTPAKQLACTLANARFLPENTADFNKPCSIIVDVQGTPAGAVTFSLWARYKGNEYNLQHENNSFVKDGRAETKLTLYYVDKHYDDFKNNGEKNVIVEYYAKVINKAAREITSEVLKMPLSNIKNGVIVELFEYHYLHESKCTAVGIPQKLLSDIGEYHKTPLLTATPSGPVYVDNKWVYIFYKQGNGVSLLRECKPSSKNNSQTFECVSWAEEHRQSNSSTYPRPVNITENKLQLVPDKEYYILLSRIQLTLSRIDYYTKNLAKLAKRALHVQANSLNNEYGPAALFLTDYIGVALYLREQFDKHARSYEEYLSDAAGVQRRYLASLVCEVAKTKPRLKEWIHFDTVFKECAANDKETNERMAGKDAAEAHLRDWKLSAGFQLTRDDYSGSREIEDQILAHEVVLTSEDEIRYLEREIENEDSWYNACVSDQSRFTFYRKLETLVANKDFADYFSKYIIGMYLANFGPSKFKGTMTIEYLVQTQERFLNHLHEIIERGKITFPDLVQNKGNWFFITIDRETRFPFIDYELKQCGRISGRSSFNTMKYREAKRKWNAAVDKALPVFQTILVGIEMVNLVNSVDTLFHSKGISEKSFSFVNTVGSATDLLSSLQFLGEKRIATMRVERGMVEKAAKESAKKTFAKINLLGAACDYVGALKDTANASAKGYNRTTAGYSVIALAAVASGASAAVTLSGAAIFGLAAGPLGVIGIALFIAGSGIVWYFSEEELRIWAEHCYWTKSYISVYSLSTQIHTLHEIICVFDTSCYLYAKKARTYLPARDLPEDYDYWFTLCVKPGFINEKTSKYRITLSIFKKGLLGNDTMVFYRTVLIPDEKTDRFPYDPNQPLQRLIRRFTSEEIGLHDDFYKEKYRYELTAKLDLDGDGTIDFPSEGKTINGDIVQTGMDI